MPGVWRFLHGDSIASNLTASAIWTIPAVLWGRRQVMRHVVRPLRTLHAKHDLLHEHVQALRSADAVSAPPEA